MGIYYGCRQEKGSSHDRGQPQNRESEMNTLYGYVNSGFYNELSVDPNGQLKLTYEQRQELNAEMLDAWHAYADELLAPYGVWLVGNELTGPIDNDLMPDEETWNEVWEEIYNFETPADLLDRAFDFNDENEAKGDAWDE